MFVKLALKEQDLMEQLVNQSAQLMVIMTTIANLVYVILDLMLSMVLAFNAKVVRYLSWCGEDVDQNVVQNKFSMVKNAFVKMD